MHLLPRPCTCFSVFIGQQVWIAKSSINNHNVSLRFCTLIIKHIDKYLCCLVHGIATPQFLLSNCFKTKLLGRKTNSPALFVILQTSRKRDFIVAIERMYNAVIYAQILINIGIKSHHFQVVTKTLIMWSNRTNQWSKYKKVRTPDFCAQEPHFHGRITKWSMQISKTRFVERAFHNINISSEFLLRNTPAHSTIHSPKWLRNFHVLQQYNPHQPR